MLIVSKCFCRFLLCRLLVLARPLDTAQRTSHGVILVNRCVLSEEEMADWVSPWRKKRTSCPFSHLQSDTFSINSSTFLCRRESGLESFVPTSLAESMKRKELKKLLGHFLKLNGNLTAPGQKNLTALQAKLHYLKIISELPSYGAKCFSTTLSVSSDLNDQNLPVFTSFYF